MARIPVRFQRLAAAFDSSGSEHSPESSTDLSDLVKSFMERAGGEGEDAVVVPEKGEEEEDDLENLEKREMLQGLLFGGSDDEDDRNAKDRIRRETELALGLVGPHSSPGFKRRLMSHLRERGFDAGLCKSRWEKNARLPASDYEYIDVNFAGKRYIVEVSLAAEFEIARPTIQYSSLLDVFPLIFVGKVDELKRVVRLMCTAMKGSMKAMDLHIPPWRRNSYMQAKWFSSYRRTTNDVATKKASPPLSLDAFTPKRSTGFEALPMNSYNCKDDYVRKTALRVGHLTAAFHVDGFGMQL